MAGHKLPACIFRPDRLSREAIDAGDAGRTPGPFGSLGSRNPWQARLPLSISRGQSEVNQKSIIRGQLEVTYRQASQSSWTLKDRRQQGIRVRQPGRRSHD